MRPERRKAGRRRTDKQPSDADVTLTNAHSAGGVRHDERGEAHWTWSTEQQSALDRTFDELKALDNESLRLLDADPAPKRPRAGGGYDPYDAAGVKKPKPKR